MTEPEFTRAVHKKLPPTVWVWKICDPYMGGIPDAYYRATDGGNPLWVEYKYLKQLPARDTTMIIPNLSALQLKMLDDTLKAEQQVAVIVGFGRGGVVFEHQNEWVNGITKSDFVSRLVGYKPLAEYIERKVGRNVE